MGIPDACLLFLLTADFWVHFGRSLVVVKIQQCKKHKKTAISRRNSGFDGTPDAIRTHGL